MDENKETNLNGTPVTPTPVETVTPSVPTEPVASSTVSPTTEPAPKKEKNKTVTIAIIVLILAVAAVLGYFGGRMLYEKVNGPIATE